MKRDEIVGGLRRLKVETGSIACLGCGWENSCGVHGCRIMREAADMLENDEICSSVLQDAIEKWKKVYGRLHGKHIALLEQNGKRDWIPVGERLPEEHESIFAKAYGTKHWADGMFRTISADVLACVAFDDGRKTTMTLRTHDGAWALSSIHRGHVTHWMPLPEPPKEEE